MHLLTFVMAICRAFVIIMSEIIGSIDNRFVSVQYKLTIIEETDNNTH